MCSSHLYHGMPHWQARWVALPCHLHLGQCVSVPRDDVQLHVSGINEPKATLAVEHSGAVAWGGLLLVVIIVTAALAEASGPLDTLFRSHLVHLTLRVCGTWSSLLWLLML